MYTGKFPEISYKRTVLKKMSHISENMKPGVDAATIRLEDVTLVMSSNCILEWFEGCERYTIQKTVNCLAEKAGKPSGIQLEWNLPEKYDERKLGEKMKTINQEADRIGLPILQCRVYKGKVEDAILHITVVGTTKKEYTSKDIQPGMDIVMAGTAGCGATAILSKVYEKELRERFPGAFVRECQQFWDFLSVESIAEIVQNHDVSYMHHVSDGGVFGAVWELGSCSNKGVKINVKDVPVWQHSIEVAEFLDGNPYLMEGTGAMLIVCRNGQELAEELKENNIMSSVIGQITDNNDRIVWNGEENRFLEPPRGDQIYELLQKHSYK
ncbi:MAG: hypothetical protein K6G64_05055 [Eubacterium sp.]|nr:hypothetical protein [Eubacterium sp.]